MKNLVWALIILQIFTKSSSSQTWLVSCMIDADCNALKNATCLNGFCNCGENLYVCDVNNVNVNQVHFTTEKCDNFRDCSTINSECNGDNLCVCKEGFVFSEDSKMCVNSPDRQCVTDENCSSISPNGFIGDNCKNSEKCQQNQSVVPLICNQGKCKCPTNYTADQGFCKETNNSYTISVKNLNFQFFCILILIALIQ